MPNFLCQKCQNVLPDTACKLFANRAFCPVCRQEMRLVQHEEAVVSTTGITVDTDSINTQLSSSIVRGSLRSDEIILACETALSQNNLDVDALVNITKRYLSLTNYEDAYRYYQRLLAIDKSLEPVTELTRLFESDVLKNKWYQLTVKNLEHALQYDQLPNAKKALDRCLSLQDESIQTLQLEASYYQAAADTKKVIVTLKRLIKRTPKDPYVWLNLAISYFEVHNLKFCRLALKNAKQFDTHNQCTDDISQLKAELDKLK